MAVLCICMTNGCIAFRKNMTASRMNSRTLFTTAGMIAISKKADISSGLLIAAGMNMHLTTDILRNFFLVCRNEYISSNKWWSAWQEVFPGTKLYGKSIDVVWKMFAASDFANLSSYSYHGSGSDLLNQYPIRDKVEALSANHK